MSKINIQSISSLTNEQSAITALANNETEIETKSDTFLSRDGATPNHMLSSLDMNSQRIINLPEPLDDSEPVRLVDLDSFAGGITGDPGPPGADGAPGTDGTDGSLIFIQNSAPSSTQPIGSMWIDADSTDQDLYNNPAGTAWVDTGVNLKGATGATGPGGGDVAATLNFGTDNRLIRSDGVNKNVQASGITVDDSDNVSAVASLALLANPSSALQAATKQYVDGLCLDFVRDYGAVGDDSTANDTAWSNFIDALISTGKPGYVPKGTYRVTTTTKSVTATLNFHLFGPGVIKRMNDVTSPLLSVTGGASVLIEGLTFTYSNGSTSVSGNHQAVRIVGGTNPTIRNVKILGAWYEGIELRDTAAQGTFDSCFAQGQVNRSFYFQGAAASLARLSVINCSVDGQATTNYGININIGAAFTDTDIVISGNRIYNCKNHGIGLRGGNCTVTGNTVSHIDTAGGTGILVQLTNTVQPLSNTISGNAINNCAAIGIAVNGGSSGSISGNSINNCPAGIETQLISATPTQHYTISGNSIINATYGILDIEGNYLSIVGNSIKTSTYGIYLSGSTKCLVNSNTIALAGNGSVGVDIAASGAVNSTNHTIRSNYITVVSGTGTIGILSDAGSSNIRAALNILDGVATSYTLGGSTSYSVLPIADGGTSGTTAATARTALGVGTSDTPQFGGIELGAASDTTISRNAAGLLDVEGQILGPQIPMNTQTAAYGILLTDGNKCIYHPSSDNNARTFTIPANATVAFPIGTTLTFVNEINTVTIAITSDTMTLAGTGTTGSRTLAANGIATALKVAATKWVISGNGLT